MPYNDAQRRTLLQVAREAIAFGLKHRQVPAIDFNEYDEKLRELRATFVTLHHGGDLRGCIGTLQPTRPLVEDVAAHAYAAAFNDPRFNPLTETEQAGLEISISILNPQEPIDFADEEDLLGQLRPGVDGLVLEDPARGARGTFLPAVWQTLPDREKFWTHLKKKANLAPDYWSDTLRVWRYTTESVK